MARSCCARARTESRDEAECQSDRRSLPLLATGYASLGVAGLGVVLPLLPTTPFLLVALWAFGRSSPDLAARLRASRLFGPALRDWQDAGVIAPKARQRALTVMAVGAAWLTYAVRDPLAVSAALACMGGAAAFIVTRPAASAKPIGRLDDTGSGP